ncbi:type III pantothenate kinase [Deltaproteobacteria bacterium TL4]
MILAFDIGNTNIVLAVFKDAQILQSWRKTTDSELPEQEYETWLIACLNSQGIELGQLQGSIISTVVPKLLPVFNKMVRKLIGKEPIGVSPKLNLGITLAVDAPEKVGQDRIVNAVAVYQRHASSSIVIDFGTATTLDVISHLGAFSGGIICPGVGIIREALVSKTSQLFHVELEPPSNVIGTNTTDSLKSGLFYGYASMIEALVGLLIKEMQCRNEPVPLVVATGGLSRVFKNAIPSVQQWDGDLTLWGLYLIYQKND